MASVWDDPPTEDERKSGGVWDAPPTAVELRGVAQDEQPQEGLGPLAAAQPQVETDIQESERDAEVSALFDASKSHEPDRYARIVGLHRASGAPIDIVEKNFDAFEKSAASAQFDARRWRDENPHLDFLLREQPQLSPIILKEKKLGWFSSMMRWFDQAAEESQSAGRERVRGKLGDDAARLLYGEAPQEQGPEIIAVRPSDLSGAAAIADAYSRRRKQSEISTLGTMQMILDARADGGTEQDRALAFENEKRALRIQDALGAQPEYATGVLGGAGVIAFESLASQMDTFIKGGLGGAAAGAVAGVVAGAITKSPVAASKLAGIGAGLGFKGGAALMSFNQEAGSSYLEFKRMVDDTGKPMDPAVARGAAVLYGLAAAGVELATLGPMLRAFGPVGEAIASGQGIKAVAKSLTHASTVAKLAEIGKRWGKSALAEGAEEATQSLLQDVSGWLGLSASAGRAQKFDRAGAMSRAEESFTKGTLGSALGIGAAQVIASVTQMEIGRRAALRANAVIDLATTPSLKAAPKEIARLIEAETERSGQKVTHLYVDPQKVVESIQRDNANLEESVTELLGENGADRLSQAMAERTDEPGRRATLAVSVEEFIDKWSDKPIVEAIRKDVTASPSGYTARDEILFQSDKKAEAKRIEQESLGEAADDDLAPGPNEKTFAKTITDQLVTSGRMTRDEARVQVTPMRAFFRTMAKRIGSAADALFEGATLMVQSELDALVGPPRASRRMTDQLRLMDQPKRGALLHLDKNTGLLNQRGFSRMPARSDKPFVAHYSIEGIKWKNKQSHTAGNELYRLAGQELGKLVDDAAKWGGDFVSSAATPAEAQEVAAKLEAAVAKRLQELNPEIAGEIGGLQVTVGSAERGADLNAAVSVASGINQAEKDRRLAAQSRVERGNRPLGIPVEDPAQLKLPSEQAPLRDLPRNLVERTASLSEEEIFTEAMINPLTGLLSKEAWDELPRKKYTVSMDLTGLKLINDEYGKDVGNSVLRAFSKIAVAAGGNGIDLAHLSGDEFAAQHDDQETLQLFVDLLAEAAKDAILEVAPGRFKKGFEFGYGIGKDYDAADRLVEEYKERNRTDPGHEERQRRERVSQALDRGGFGDIKGRASLARGSGAQGYAGVRKLPRESIRETRSLAERYRQLNRLRFEALSGYDTREIAQKLLQLSSPESQAVAGATAARIIPPKPQAPRFKSKRDAFDSVLIASNFDSITPIEDSRYRAALDGKGDMPAPLEGGTLDAVNGRLNLEGGKRVNSMAHAFDLLMADAKGSREQKAAAAVEAMNEVESVGGRLRLPDEFTEALADAEARGREAEHYRYDPLANDLDDSFDPSAFDDDDTLKQSRAVKISGRTLQRDDGITITYHEPFERGAAGADVEAEYRGSVIGSASFTRVPIDTGSSLDWESGPLKGWNVNVAPDYRRRGIASDMYRLAESVSGKPVVPGDFRTPDGEMFLGADDDTLLQSQIAFEPTQVKSATGNVGTFDPSDPSILRQDEDKKDGPRGWVELAKEGMRRAFRVFLTEKSDLSTFFHESAHVYFEMFGDLAEHEAAGQRVKDDWASILKWLGAESRDKLTVDQKEQFARAFEAYMREGQTPSVPLAETFGLSRLWMSEVYKSLDSLQVELNDDVRGIFDRMLATDAEIQRAKNAAGLSEPLWRSNVDAGMTPQQWAKYLDERQKITTKTALMAQRQIYEAQLRAAKAFKSSQFKRFKEQAAAEFDNRQDWRAWRYIGKGEYRHADGAVTKDKDLGKIDRQLFRDLMGDDHPLEKKLRGRLTDDGDHPSSVAETMGYASGREMLDAIASMPERDDTIQARAEELMRERHPEIDGEMARLEQLIAESVNAESSDVLLEELAHLERRAGAASVTAGVDVARFPWESAKEAAKSVVSDRTLDRLDPGVTLNRERTAANKTAAEAAKGNFEQARVQKRKQIFYHHMWRELTKAKQERDRFEDLLKTMGDRQRREVMAKAGKDFLDASDQILESIGVKQAPAAEAERESVDAILLQIEQIDGAGFDRTEVMRVVNTAPGEWKRLTVGQMRDVHRALAQLYTLARDRNSIIVDGKRVLLDDLVGTIDSEASERKDLGPPPEKPKHWRGLMANLLEPIEALRRLGPTGFKVLWSDGYIAAEKAEDALARKVGKFFAEQWDKLPKEMQIRRYELLEDLDGVPWPDDIDKVPTLDRAWMWMVALNMGNRSNRDRLLGGYKWDERAVLDWLNRNMTDEEWGFIEGVWKLLDEQLYPEVSRVHEESNGLPPDKIEATPIQTPFGEVSGGYFPARYEPVASRVGQRQSREALEKLYHQRSGAISVAKSFTKQRAKKFEDIIRLDWDVVPGHVMTVIHYVAFDRFVRQARSLITHPGFAQTARHYVGSEVYDTLEDPDLGWLATAASAAADAIPRTLHSLYWGLGIAKRSTFAGSIGWSFITAAADFAQPLIAAISGKVKARYIGASMAKVYSLGIGWGAMRKRALELGHEPQHRSDNVRRKVRADLAEIGEAGKRNKAWAAFRDSAFVFLDMTDAMVTTIIWDAAFSQAMDEGKGQQQAVDAADEAVAFMQPPQDQARKPLLLRDKRAVGQLLVFYGYFSKLHNIARGVLDPALQQWATAEDGGRLDAAGNVAKKAGQVLAIFFVAQVMGELLSGRGPDEDEEVSEWVIRKMLAAPFMLFPWMGGPAEEVINRGVSYVADGEAKRRQFNVRSAPAFSALEKLWSAVERAADDEREPEKRVLDTIEAFGIATGTPFGSPQIRRTVGYVFEGEDRSGLGVARGLLYGEREGMSMTPLGRP